MPGTVAGFDGYGLEGLAYRSRNGYLFHDASGDGWWIIFQRYADADPDGPEPRGDVLACSASQGEMVHVRVLAEGVLEADADAAFAAGEPATFEDAVRVAAGAGARTV